MPLPTIDALIDKLDNAEAIRDQISAILLAETAAQQTLATDASEDPRLWTWRVFSERSNPWEEFRSASDDAAAQVDVAPIVHVAFAGDTFDKSKSNQVERQAARGTFYIDCYGYGVAESSGNGYAPGDARASAEAHRIARLIRNVLMASTYTYLDLRGTVWRRWITGREVFHPDRSDATLGHVMAVRITLEVDYSEFAPQYTAETVERVGVTVLRKETGEVYLDADWPDGAPDP